MADDANLEVISVQLKNIGDQLARIERDQIIRMDKLEHEVRDQAKQIRSLEDYKLRAQTVTVPLSIVFSTALGVAVKFALDAFLK